MTDTGLYHSARNAGRHLRGAGPQKHATRDRPATKCSEGIDTTTAGGGGGSRTFNFLEIKFLIFIL